MVRPQRASYVKEENGWKPTRCEHAPPAGHGRPRIRFNAEGAKNRREEKENFRFLWRFDPIA